MSVLYYFDNQDFNEEMLAKRMKTKPEIGTSLGNMVKFFKEIGWEVQSSIGKPPMDKVEFQKFVMKNLSAGNPIMVENVEFGGHWRVIIGVDTMGTEIIKTVMPLAVSTGFIGCGLIIACCPKRSAISRGLSQFQNSL